MREEERSVEDAGQARVGWKMEMQMGQIAIAPRRPPQTPCGDGQRLRDGRMFSNTRVAAPSSASSCLQI